MVPDELRRQPDEVVSAVPASLKQARTVLHPGKLRFDGNGSAPGLFVQLCLYRNYNTTLTTHGVVIDEFGTVGLAHETKSFSADVPPPRAGAGVSRDVGVAIACAVVTVLVAGFPLLIEPHFFYTDDYQTYFMPMFHEVARLVSQGQAPFITDRIWRGGALLAEYQPAVLNPISLLLYLGIYQMHSAPAAAAVFSLTHLALFAAGTYVLCRALRCAPTYAALAAVTAPTTEWILYWGAANWIPALVSIAWLPWALAALAKLYGDMKWFLPAVLGTAMVIVSGWPFALLALAIVVLIVSLFVVPHYFRENFQRLFPVYLALLTAALLAAPAILPMIPYARYSERPFETLIRWRSTLAAVTAVGMPFYRSIWSGFSGVKPVALPMTYVAWFAPVVIANAGWKKLLRNPVECCIFQIALWLAAISMLPMLGQFRWMFRLLPYYHLAVIVLVALILNRADAERQDLRVVPTIAAIALPLVIAVVSVPRMLDLYAASAALAFALAMAGLVLQKSGRFVWAVFAVVSNILVFWSVNYSFVTPEYPTYPNSMRSPFLMSEGPVAEGAKRHISISRTTALVVADDWRDLKPGNTSLFTSVVNVGGYSPFDPKPYRQHFCPDYLGMASCPEIVQHLSVPIGPEGNLLDLMRVEEVSIVDRDIASLFDLATARKWRSVARPTGTTLFTRDLGANSLPDPVSWSADHMDQRVIVHTASQIVMDVDNQADAEGAIVMARAWYPGWKAELDGVSLPVDALYGILLEVKIPPHTRGHLVIDYWPAGLNAGMGMSALGFVVLLVVLVLQSRRGRRWARLRLARALPAACIPSDREDGPGGQHSRRAW